MHAALRASEWDEVRVQHRGVSITYVYRRGPGEARFAPWLVVAPSALLARVGARGLGLYAARALKPSAPSSSFLCPEAETRVLSAPHS